MEPQLQNWENFCRVHACGDWHGTWTKYSPSGEVMESFRGIRSLYTSSNGSEIYLFGWRVYVTNQTSAQLSMTEYL
ncbi:MAG: DUF3598 family protein [Coleofasciculaceae cyanobacterium]